VYATQIERPYASFVVHNDPQIEVISNLVNQNYIVRTRIDANLIYDEQNYNDAIASGAQILSSDFLIARKDLAEEQRIYLPNNKMIIKRES
ncbi:MAG: hypothetical protein IH571_01550, partial [Acholeplasmataceae bacterium]|nr:hypothetical protein [Acholeplasmataceae bacterium]